MLFIFVIYIESTCTTFRIRFLLPIPCSWIFSIRTTPAIFANKVWSVPIPTFSPARNFCPRCLTKIEPALAGCLWRILTPRRRPIESRPLLVDPPAFLVAIPLTVVVVTACGAGWWSGWATTFLVNKVAAEEERFASVRIIIVLYFICVCFAGLLN